MTGAAIQANGRHGSITLPWRSMLMGVVAVLAYLVPGAAPEALVFDRVAIAQGEWWRLLTGHWVHSDPAHAGWDITALLLLGALFEPRLQWRLPLALLIGTVGVNAWLWWMEPALRYYCGLSGILNSLLIVGLLQLWRDCRDPLVLLTGVAAAAKILLDAWLVGTPGLHLVDCRLADSRSGGCIGIGRSALRSLATGDRPVAAVGIADGVDGLPRAVGERQGNLVAGTYYLTITDSIGCTRSDTFMLQQPNTLGVFSQISDTNGWEVACYSDSSGWIQLTPFGGADSTQNTYFWSTPDGYVQDPGLMDQANIPWIMC